MDLFIYFINIYSIYSVFFKEMNTFIQQVFIT